MFRRLEDFYKMSNHQGRVFWRAVLELTRWVLLIFGDSSYQSSIRGKEILLPISHKLPIYISNYSYYDTLPIRLTNYLRNRYGFLSVVDVGANVGDTIVSCFASVDDRFLAIEANPKFASYLNRNCREIPNFSLVEIICSSEDNENLPIRIEASNGTAKTIRDYSGFVMPSKKLDTIMEEYPNFFNCNFLKIDTDGNDFKVISGAQKFIKSKMPVILMECDIFDNQHYIRDFSETMHFLSSVGYETAIAYDNFGYLRDIFLIKDYVDFIRHSLFHQMISNFGYFDILIINKENQPFVDLELKMFSDELLEKNRKKAVSDILGL